VNTCPKCGSPQVEEQTNYAKETGRTWWVCGTFQTRDFHPHHSELCLEREEKNTLQAKLDDLQASTIHSCGDSCSRPMCVLRKKRNQWREFAEKLAEALWQESPSLEIPSARHSALMEFEKLKQSDKWNDGGEIKEDA
jgi:hypothetical protein